MFQSDINKRNSALKLLAVTTILEAIVASSAVFFATTEKYALHLSTRI